MLCEPEMRVCLIRGSTLAEGITAPAEKQSSNDIHIPDIVFNNMSPVNEM